MPHLSPKTNKMEDCAADHGGTCGLGQGSSHLYIAPKEMEAFNNFTGDKTDIAQAAQIWSYLPIDQKKVFNNPEIVSMDKPPKLEGRYAKVGELLQYVDDKHLVKDFEEKYTTLRFNDLMLAERDRNKYPDPSEDQRKLSRLLDRLTLTAKQQLLILDNEHFKNEQKAASTILQQVNSDYVAGTATLQPESIEIYRARAKELIETALEGDVDKYKKVLNSIVHERLDLRFNTPSGTSEQFHLQATREAKAFIQSQKNKLLLSEVDKLHRYS